MIWTTPLKPLGSKEFVEYRIPERHATTGEQCETFGACAIDEATEMLRMALELFLEGRTLVPARSRHFTGHFWSFTEDDLVRPWI
jgi:hypothetical protein